MQQDKMITTKGEVTHFHALCFIFKILLRYFHIDKNSSSALFMSPLLPHLHFIMIENTFESH